jgi:hypothetical protein
MRLLVRIFGGLVALWLVLLGIGLFLPGRYRVERSVEIAASRESVFGKVADLRAWRQWGIWYERDPGMTVSYSPATTEVGAWSEWKSRTQGDGRMTITKSHAPDAFAYRMDFSDIGMQASGGVLLAAEAGGTRVTMTMEGDLGRSPVSRWFGLFMDRLIGPDFDAGLAKLKRLCESGSP